MKHQEIPKSNCLEKLLCLYKVVNIYTSISDVDIAFTIFSLYCRHILNKYILKVDLHIIKMYLHIYIYKRFSHLFETERGREIQSLFHPQWLYGYNRLMG